MQTGILLMIGAAVTFGIQDGLSRFLAEEYGPISVIAIRYWFFLLFQSLQYGAHRHHQPIHSQA